MLGISAFLVQSCGSDAKRRPTGSKGQTGDGSSEKCEPDIVCMRVKPSASGLVASVETYAGIEVTLSFNMTLTNLASATPLPATYDLSSLTNLDVTTLTQVDADSSFSYKYEYRYGWGRRNVTHDDGAVYRLPFETGTARTVIQGYNGSFTHKDNDRFAVDFGMPEGTKVFAARDGIVADFVENYTEGGALDALKDKANAVRIVHEDGSIGSYLHLRQNGVEVTRGATVKSGDLIGYSGNTGYSSEPHLHFEVSKRIDVDSKSTIGTVFRTSDGNSVTLVQGTGYTAVD